MDDSDHVEDDVQTKSSHKKLYKIFLLLAILFLAGGIGASIAAIVIHPTFRYNQKISPPPTNNRKIYKRKSTKSTKTKPNSSSSKNSISHTWDSMTSPLT